MAQKGQSQINPFYTILSEMEKIWLDFVDSFTKKLEEMRLQMDQDQEEPKSFAEKVDKKLEDIKDQITMDVVAGEVYEIQEEQKDIQSIISRMEESVDGHDWKLLIIQHKELDSVLFLLGMKEGKEEELKNGCVDVFSAILWLDFVDMYEENLPRDDMG